MRMGTTRDYLRLTSGAVQSVARGTPHSRFAVDEAGIKGPHAEGWVNLKTEAIAVVWCHGGYKSLVGVSMTC